MHEMTTREAIRHGVVNPTLRKPGTSQPRIYTAEDDDDYALARDLDRALRGTEMDDDDPNPFRSLARDIPGMDDDDKAEADELDDCALDDAEFLVLSSLGNRVAELSTATVALKRQSSGDSESWSEVASEWSVVSAAESAWTTVADEPVPTPLVPTSTRSWGTTADDAAFARKLQMEEWDSLLPARPSMNASSAFARKSRRLAHLAPAPPCRPSVAPAALRQLREACGLCVVCREAVALVAWEPCGHLALCEACHDQIPAYQRDHCVVCRTQGHPVYLLRPCDAGGAWSAPPARVAAAEEEEAAVEEAARAEDDEFDLLLGAGLSVSADDGTLGTLHPVFSRALAEREIARAGVGESKLAYRRAKRQINARAKAVKRSGFMHSEEFEVNHPFLAPFEEARRWREEQEVRAAKQRVLARGWTRHSSSWHYRQPRLIQMARQRRTLSRDEQRLHAQHMNARDPENAARRKAEARKVHLGTKRTVKELLKSARVEEEERELMLRRAATTAEHVSKSMGGACRACGEREACMLALRCRHVTLCRECWECGGGMAEGKQPEPHEAHGGKGRATGSGGGGGAWAACLECGGECKLAIQIFRPLA